MDDAARWTVSVSPGTDISVRAYLAQCGMRQGALSRFVEEGVKWRLLDLSLADARTGFADLSTDELNNLIEEAVTDARKH